MISCIFTILRQRKLKHFSERAKPRVQQQARAQQRLHASFSAHHHSLMQLQHRHRPASAQPQTRALRQWQGTSSGRPSGSTALSGRAIGLPALASRAAGRGRASDRVTGRPGASSRSIWATCPGAWATRKGACPCRSARARRPQQHHQRDNARASSARAGSVGSGLSHVGQSDVGHSPHHTHTHTRTLLPACMYNKYVLPHLPTPTHETRV